MNEEVNSPKAVHVRVHVLYRTMCMILARTYYSPLNLRPCLPALHLVDTDVMVTTLRQSATKIVHHFYVTFALTGMIHDTKIKKEDWYSWVVWIEANFGRHADWWVDI